MFRDNLFDSLELLDSYNPEDNKPKSEFNDKFFGSLDNYLFKDIDTYFTLKDLNQDCFSGETIAMLKKSVSTAKKLLDRKNVIDGKFKSEFENTDTNMRKEWSEKIPYYNGNTLKNLVFLQLVYPNKIEINALRTKIHLLDNWPVTQEAFDKYEQAKNDANSLIEKQNFDSDIEAFLKKVSEKSATIFDLTEKVLEWIKENNYSQNFRILIKS